MSDEMIIDYWKKGYSVEQIVHFFPSVKYGRKEPSWQMINRVETLILEYNKRCKQMKIEEAIKEMKSLSPSENAIETLVTAYARELVKNSELEELLENSVSIDMIKAKIEELNDTNSKFSQRVIKSKEFYLTELVQNILRELIEKR